MPSQELQKLQGANVVVTSQGVCEMNITRNDAHHRSHRDEDDAFVQRALARIDHVKRAAQELTETLGLPKEAYHAILSGMTPILLEALAEIEQATRASSRSSERSLPEDTPHRS
jgi:hypothetical protein